MALIYRESGFLRNLDEDSAAAYIIDGRLAVGNTAGGDNWALDVGGNVRMSGTILYMSSDIINLGGDNNQLSGVQARTFGDYNFAAGNNTLATGFATLASGDQSTTLGTGTVASRDNSLALGQYNTNTANVLLSVGMGKNAGNRADAFRIMEDGTAYMPRLTTGGGIYIKGPIQGSVLDVEDPDGSRYGLAVYSNSRTQVYGVGNVSVGFDTPQSNAINDVYTFTSDGRLGIGVLDPKANLHVAGNAYISGDLFVTGNQVQLSTTQLVSADPITVLAANSRAVGAPQQDIGFIGEHKVSNVAFVWRDAASEFAVFRTNQSGAIKQFTDVQHANLHVQGLIANSIVVSNSATLRGPTRFTSDVKVDTGLTASYLTLTQPVIPPDAFISFVPGVDTDPFPYTTTATYDASNNALQFDASKRQNLNLCSSGGQAIPVQSIGWSFAACVQLSTSNFRLQ
jgi:hypothetical protein